MRGWGCWLSRIALAVSLLSAANAAGALTITVVGAPGSAGGGAVDGGTGGSADAIAISPDATNEARATGGVGGYGGNANGGAGGLASATAETSFAGAATAVATAIGGDGGLGAIGGHGGLALAEASAHGDSGSQAQALATGGLGGPGAEGGSGGDATLVDAVSGSDPVSLVLEQRATGGDTGGNIVSVGNAHGGTATSRGDFTNSSGGDVSALLVAIGGNSAEEAGGAHVGGSVTSVGSGDAVLDAIARSGLGNVGGSLVIDPLLAHATGSGNASASLEAELRVEAGALSVVNAVDADASSGASIALRQTAKAEHASESILEASKSVALLDVEANADGGDASITVRGRNDAGDVRLSGEARGGDGSPDLGPLDARAEFDAETSGDGHDIEIGSALRAARAVGGGGDQGDAVPGGDASVMAAGTALGNSAVHIDVIAEGGSADEFVNGNARATATGQGSGTELVDVTATALGGSGFFSVGGDARAEALAIGEGQTNARAIARGGIHDESTPGSAGFAVAKADGESGTAKALSSTTRLFGGEDADDEQLGAIAVGLEASVAGETGVAASSHMLDFAADPTDPTLDGVIRSAYQADAALLAAALSGNSQAASEPTPRPLLFALVELELRSGEGIERTFTADIVFGNGFSSFGDKPEAVRFSFLDPELDAAIFSSLTLRSWDTRDPSDVYEITFASALDALAFLDDGRLVFGGLPRQRHLELVFETTGAEGAFFLDLVVAAVSEPCTGFLLGLSALALTGRAANARSLARRG